MSASEGLRQYRTGGGKIRSSDWYYLRRLSADAAEVSEDVSYSPTANVVPDSAHTPIGWDYRQDYVATGVVTGFDPDTGEGITVHVTVESSEPLTLEQWSNAILSKVHEKEGSKPVGKAVLRKVNFYKPTRVW